MLFSDVFLIELIEICFSFSFRNISASFTLSCALCNLSLCFFIFVISSHEMFYYSNHLSDLILTAKFGLFEKLILGVEFYNYKIDFIKPK
jgi:hypothetical protein